MMNDLRKVLIGPLLTEKSTIAKEKNNVISLVVRKSANKQEVKRAIEEIFKVNVGSVRTINVAGKTKRSGKKLGKRSNWKKAFVTLKKGESIEIFDGV